MIQGGDDRGAPLLQEEEHHDGEGEVGDPGPGNAAGDTVSSGPAAHGEHQVPHARVQLSVQVEQLCALDCHPVERKQHHCHFRTRGLAACFNRGRCRDAYFKHKGRQDTEGANIIGNADIWNFFRFILVCSTSTATSPFSYSFSKISTKS